MVKEQYNHSEIKALRIADELVATPEQTTHVLSADENGLSADPYRNAVETLARSSENVLNLSQLNIAVAKWALQAPLEVFEYIQGLSEDKKQQLMPVLMAVAGQTKNPELQQWLHRNQQHVKHDYWAQSYYHAYADKAPKEALLFLEKNYSGNKQAELVLAVVDAWATKDVGDVFEWLQGRENSTLTKELRLRALKHYIKKEPEQAAAMVAQLNSGDDKNQLVAQTAEVLAQIDIYDAIDWAETLSEDERAAALSSLMHSWAAEGLPELALDYVLADEKLQDNNDVLLAAVSSVASLDYQVLVARLPDFNDKHKQTVVQQISSALMHSGRVEEFEVWYQSLPIGAQREAASLPAISANVRTRPDLAFKYAENIISAQDRQRYLSEAAQSWANSEPSLARAAIEFSEVLSEQQKHKILAELP